MKKKAIVRYFFICFGRWFKTIEILNVFKTKVFIGVNDFNWNPKNRHYRSTVLFPKWGARGAMVIVVGNGHGDKSSNPGWDWLYFT